MDERLMYRILSAVGEIPAGCVATYGQIARAAGLAGRARLAGRALRLSGPYGEYPCHRVVNHAGRLAPGFYEQRALLEAEGVPFLADGRVDIARCRWDY